MRDCVPVRQGKKSLKDIILGTPSETPRRKMNWALAAPMLFVAIGALALFIADWVTGSASVMLGILPWLLIALGWAPQASHSFRMKEEGAAKYAALLWVAVGLLGMVFALMAPLRQWP